jgi:copper(I)-binding protein
MRSLIIALVASAASVAQAAPATVTVAQPWSRPAAAGTTGAGFFTLINGGKAPDSLIAAESPVARKVEIHRSSMAGGVMRMNRLDRVPIPPGGRVIFAPGGYHLMLMNLAKPLNPGDRFPLTLVFASGARAPVEMVVGSGAAPSAPAQPHH